MKKLTNACQGLGLLKTNGTHQGCAENYPYWRLRMFYSIYAGYLVFYFTRKSLAIATPDLIEKLNFSTVQIGLLITLFSIAYGISKFISGVISDRSNPRYFLSIGLILTGVINIILSFSSEFYLFAIFWTLNAWFQGFGWPPCAKILTHWFSKKERGRWWASWNTAHNVGGALIPIIASTAALFLGWRAALWVPGIIAIVMGLILINRLRNTPESLGLPKIEYYKNDDVAALKTQPSNPDIKNILTKYILNNKIIWILALTYTLIYLIRNGVNDWAILYFTQQGMDNIKAASMVTLFEVGGFFGSLAAGFWSDYFFSGKRGPINVLFSLGSAMGIVTLLLFPEYILIFGGYSIFAIGFFIFGPQMLIGVAAAEQSHREAAGAATGFIGLFGYLGAAISGVPLGYIMQTWGWKGFFITLTLAGIMATLLLMPTWKTSLSNNEDQDEDQDGGQDEDKDNLNSMNKETETSTG
ncbi:MAG: phosphoglycerate transporter protein PgtP [Cellvibrionales bacterium]|nr:phosphoglycerate transporter protein PgtP [Cellvibrionales bacterium]